MAEGQINFAASAVVVVDVATLLVVVAVAAAGAAGAAGGRWAEGRSGWILRRGSAGRATCKGSDTWLPWEAWGVHGRGPNLPSKTG